MGEVKDPSFEDSENYETVHSEVRCNYALFGRCEINWKSVILHLGCSPQLPWNELESSGRQFGRSPGDTFSQPCHITSDRPSHRYRRETCKTRRSTRFLLSFFPSLFACTSAWVGIPMFPRKNARLGILARFSLVAFWARVALGLRIGFLVSQGSRTLLTTEYT